jgi:SAM-dependent methyltransferase
MSQMPWMRALERLHAGTISQRRIRRLCGHLAPLFPPHACALDVGCGDGRLDVLLAQARPDLSFQGIDVLIQPQVSIPVQPFDGHTIPYGPGSFDVVLLVDTLHHTNDPMSLLREAARVARRAIVIKDHVRDGFLADPTLRFMDRVGNARFGISLPHTYWPKARWFEAFDELHLTVGVWKPRLKLYPWPFDWLFDRSLHFIARLDLAPRAGADPGVERGKVQG